MSVRQRRRNEKFIKPEWQEVNKKKNKQLSMVSPLRTLKRRNKLEEVFLYPTGS